MALFRLLFRSGKTRPPLHRVGIPKVLQGKRAPETIVKFWARSNGRIKSYGPFQLLFNWRDNTSSYTSWDSIDTSRKRGSGNNCKTLTAIQQRIKCYGPFQLLFRYGATRPPLHQVGIPKVLQGKRAPETTVKFWARSNGRIKSYGPFQLLFNWRDNTSS